SRRRHTRSKRDCSSDVCSSDLTLIISSNTGTVEGKTDPNGSIGSSSNGIAVVTDPAGPHTTSSNGLSLKLTPNGSIQSSSTGLRSEEQTSELQSRFDLVFRLPL